MLCKFLKKYDKNKEEIDNRIKGETKYNNGVV